MGRILPLTALMLAACGTPQTTRTVASAESIDRAVVNAERELAAAKAGSAQGAATGLFGA